MELLENLEFSSNDPDKVIQETWAPEWSEDQWIEKKDKYTWLMSQNKKIRCRICKEFDDFKSYKNQNIEMAKEWTSCQIDGGENIKKKIRLSLLRNKMKKHSTSKAHMTAVKIATEKESNKLIKNFEETAYNVNKTTISIFRTAYYIAKRNHLMTIQNFLSYKNLMD